jgi:hypothetical protein
VIWLRAFLATCLVAVSWPVGAAPRGPDDFTICGLICSARDLQRLQRQLSVPPIGAFRRSGVTVYRALAVDGWAHPMWAFTFRRSSKGLASVEIRHQGLLPQTSRLSGADWDRVADLLGTLPLNLAADRAQRQAAAHPADGGVGMLTVCADGPSYRLESLRPVEQSRFRGIART